MKRFLILILVNVVILNNLHAVFLRDVPRELKQPDGTTLHCFISGDEFYNYLHDAEGYTIIQNSETGYFVYADEVAGKLIPSSYIPGRDNPANAGLKPNLNISAEEWIARRELKATPSAPSSILKNQKTSAPKNRGAMNNIVVFIRFADDTAFTDSYSQIEGMFNDSTESANSMYNYFKTTSYNQLHLISHFFPKPENDLIISYQDSLSRDYFLPFSASNPLGYSNSNNEKRNLEHQLLSRAIHFIDSMIPDDLVIDYNGDGLVDNVCFLIKGDVGDWNDLLWPHRWSLYSNETYLKGSRVWDYTFQLVNAPSYFTTSVLCHEMFHSLGAPDLYHYYYYTNLSPVGQWDLMEKNLDPPQQTNAYMKFKYGNWLDEIPEITQSGKYTLYPLNSSNSNKVCYKIASSADNQFYLLEYRKNDTPFDGVPNSGLLIYRINTSFDGNANYNHQSILDEVYLFRRFGNFDENGAITQSFFRAGVRSEFNYNTDPYPFFSDGSKDFDFNIQYVSEASDSITFFYEKPSGIDPFSSENLISIYPNPVKNTLIVERLQTNIPSVDFEIYDIYGKIVEQGTLFETMNYVSVSALSSGIYIFRTVDKSRNHKNYKFIKN